VSRWFEVGESALRSLTCSYEVSDRAVQLVRERNELDFELYRFARELFVAQLSRQDRSAVDR